MSIKVLIVDNYDSFTYNLAHYLEALGADITVVYNDQIDLGSLSQYDKIVLSPGPGLPKESNQVFIILNLPLDLFKFRLPFSPKSIFAQF